MLDFVIIQIELSQFRQSGEDRRIECCDEILSQTQFLEIFPKALEVQVSERADTRVHQFNLLASPNM